MFYRYCCCCLYEKNLYYRNFTLLKKSWNAFNVNTDFKYLFILYIINIKILKFYIKQVYFFTIICFITLLSVELFLVYRNGCEIFAQQKSVFLIIFEKESHIIITTALKKIYICIQEIIQQKIKEIVAEK